jgi:hypothetical protein
MLYGSNLQKCLLYSHRQSGIELESEACIEINGPTPSIGFQAENMVRLITAVLYGIREHAMKSRLYQARTTQTGSKGRPRTALKPARPFKEPNPYQQKTAVAAPSPQREGVARHAHNFGNAATRSSSNRSAPTREDYGGLPEDLKAGIENLSGISLDEVKVHYNSHKSAQMEALAHTQGTDIHLGPGQEKHLAHEAWHVVQQKQGRVKPARRAGGVDVTDDRALEKEADVMGARALRAPSSPAVAAPGSSARLSPASKIASGQAPIQAMKIHKADGSVADVADDYVLQPGESKAVDKRKHEASESESESEAELKAQTEPRKRVKPGLEKSKQEKLVLFSPTAKGTPQVGLKNVYAQHGKDALEKDDTGGKQFTGNYRMKQMQFLPESGGSGLDEMVSTATTAKVVKNMTKKGEQPQAIEDTVARLSEEREEVRHLMWATGDEQQPLAAHPGALSTDPSDMTHGITQGHNTKDRVRAKWVSNQLDESTTKPLDETSAMAQIMTNQLMSQPHAQLSQVTPTVNTEQAYHPAQGPLYDTTTSSKTKAFQKATVDAHNARERRKWQTGENLMRLGHHDLVAPGMHQQLMESGGWSEALNKFNKDKGGSKLTDKGPPTSEAHVPSKDEEPMSLGEWNQNIKNKKASLKRAVSEPRELLTLPPPPVIAQPQLKQINITPSLLKSTASSQPVAQNKPVSVPVTNQPQLKQQPIEAFFKKKTTG